MYYGDPQECFESSATEKYTNKAMKKMSTYPVPRLLFLDLQSADYFTPIDLCWLHQQSVLIRGRDNEQAAIFRYDLFVDAALLSATVVACLHPQIVHAKIAFEQIEFLDTACL